MEGVCGHNLISLSFLLPMKRIYSLLLSILSGLLFTAAWPENGFAPLLFVAFVPLLFIEQRIADERYKYSFIKILPYAYLAFFIWNLATTWWVWHSSPEGSIAAFTLNTLFIAIVFSLFHVTKKRLGPVPGYLALVAYWMSFEYLHLRWELSWPWLTLGNGFSEYYTWIQWYEYTGVFGGALWIFVVNIMIYKILRKVLILKEGIGSQLKAAVMVVLVIVIPIIISLVIYTSYEEKSDPVEMVVVQPNIDPYNEKFDGMTSADQLEKMLNLAKQKLTPNTRFLVGPETALVAGAWEGKEEGTASFIRLRQFLVDYPELSIVIGLSTYKMYMDGEKPSPTARKYRGRDDMRYDAFNTGMIMDKGKPVVFYHKSKLVPGVEKMPYPQVFGFLEELAINLGGISGSLGMQDERTVFFSSVDSIGVAPAICYESVYGEYVTDYVRNGANFIFIITNDGWWHDTPGHRQHNSYARMRAIETRRSIARSANTGISCFINQRGDMQQQTKYWTPDVIKASINANDEWTFYTRFGDYIARVALLLMALLLLWTIATSLNKSKSRLG